MIKNCTNCYFNKFGLIRVASLKITNYTNLMIYFILEYNSEKGFISKKSDVFQRNEFKTITYTSSAKNVVFYVINTNPPSVIHNIICKHVLLTPNYYSFKIVQTPSGIVCVQDKEAFASLMN